MQNHCHSFSTTMMSFLYQGTRSVVPRMFRDLQIQIITLWHVFQSSCGFTDCHILNEASQTEGQEKKPMSIHIITHWRNVVYHFLYKLWHLERTFKGTNRKTRSTLRSSNGSFGLFLYNFSLRHKRSVNRTASIYSHVFCFDGHPVYEVAGWLNW